MKLLDPFAPFSMYFDREGRPIDRPRSVRDPLDETAVLRWAAMHSSSYSAVAFTQLRGHDVSTMWVGLNLSLWEPPIIFETMVFGPSAWDHYRDRYATESGALAGHMRIVNLVRRFPAGPPEVDPDLERHGDESQN